MSRYSGLIGCLLGSFLVVLPAAADDWPQWLGPARNGHSGDKGIQAWNKKGPPVAWSREVGEGYSGPVIAGERLIVFHRLGDEEVVEAWNAGTGKPLWKFSYATDYRDALGKGDGPRSTACVAGKRVVTLGVQGVLTCLDLESGAKVWQKKLHEMYRVAPSYFGVGTSPVVDGKLILVNVGAKDAGIVALALDDGKEMWKATGDGASYSSPVIANVGGTKHGIFFTRQGAVILDPQTGKVRYSQRWRATYDASVNAATPLVLGELAFFSASYETGALLLKLTKDGAAEAWSGEDVMSNHYNTCIHADGHLYGFHGRQEAGPSFRCVTLQTRKIAWDEKRFGCGSMVAADGKLIVLLESGELLLVEATPKQYRELARARVLDHGPCRAQIALAHGKLYARDQRRLVCLDLQR